MTEYKPPEFLQHQSVDEIHARMLGNLPGDIDQSEAQFPWDFTRPTAIEKAEFVEFRLNETIKIMFPQWAYGEFLDLHAETAGLKRKSANKASGILTVTGTEGTVIPERTQFATPSDNEPSILFESVEPVVIDSTGSADIVIEAADGGRTGNAAKDSVTLMVKPIKGIQSIINPMPITGGTPVEDDEHFRARIIEVLRYGVSYVGNDFDYIRWAKEVTGVGEVIVIPEFGGKGTGTVLLIIIDMNGMPANQQILEAVYNHIMSPDNPVMRLAPIGTILKVESPAPVMIDISASVVLKEGADIDTVIENFSRNLNSYYTIAADEHSVKYAYVGSVLAQTEGISDYRNLELNRETENIVIEKGYYPVTGEVKLIE